MVSVGALREYVGTVGRFERNAQLLLIGTASRGLCIGLLGTIFNLYLYSLGFSRPTIGLINGTQALATLLVSIPLGYVADRWGRKPVLLAGAVGYPLAALGLTVTRSPTAMLALTFVFGAVATTYWVASIPMLVGSSGDRGLVRVFSVNSFLLWGIGPFGALIGGLVAQGVALTVHVSAGGTVALRAALYVMAAVAALPIVPYAFLHEPEAAVKRGDVVAARGYYGLFARLMLPDAALAMGAGSVLTFVQLYYRIRFSLAPGSIGAIMAVGGIGAGFAALIAPVPARRWGNLNAAVRLQLVSAPLMVVLALAPWVFVAIPTYFALIASARMTDPIYTTFVQRQVPDALRARLTSLYSVTYAIGFSTGPTVSGYLQTVGGFTLAFLYGMSCYLVGAALLFVFFGRPATEPTGHDLRIERPV